MTAVRYTAARRRQVEAERAARVEARFARWASMPFDEFLAEYREVAIVNTPELVEDARNRHAAGFPAVVGDGA